MSFIEQAGEDLWNAGMGIVLGGFQDARQVRQQDRLQRLQIAGQKEMTDYNMMKQLEMWNATNYEAQMKHLKAAGLNPGLIYGMKGGGGVTTGNASGNVQGANAPVGGREIQDIMGMGIQKELLQAQKENIQADTKLKETEATFKGGPQTQQTEMQTDVLAQELANKREDWNIKRLEQTMKNIENWEKQASQGDRLRYIEFQTKLAIKQLEQIENEVFVSTTTIHDQIKKIQTEAAGAVIQNSLMEAGIKLSTEQANLIRKQAEKILRESQIPWDQMSQENKKIAIQQMIGEYQTDPVNTHNITKLLDNIFILTKRN